MEDIVRVVNQETLMAASHEHVEAYGLYLGRVPGGEICDTPHLAWGFSGVPSPYMNMVVRTRLGREDNIDQQIESVIGPAKSRSLPVGWFLLPGSTPEDIGSRLLAHGLESDGEDPGMAVDLHVLPEQLPFIDSLRIVEVLDPAVLRHWVDAWGQSYNDAPESMRQSRFNLRASLGLDAALPYRSFLAYLHGEPVATAELFLGAGVAAVMWVGTIPSARGKGIGAAITMAPLLEARRLGYRIGALTASPMGYHVYQQLGFREMCRIPVFRWVPEGW